MSDAAGRIAPEAADGDDQGGSGAQRSILLVVTGLSPQVVTETLYALHIEGGPLPDEVHLVTTSVGAERARLSLLSTQPGWFRRCIDDYGMGPIAFPDENIHVLTDPSGRPMADLTTAEDNSLAADQIGALVRMFTRDDVRQLHVSIAGGRKTMGFLAGYALSLWGRRGDRLSHVLVSDSFEQSWDFFYPTPYERIIEIRNGKIVNCADARVALADIPFVRLRHVLPESMLMHQADFASAVKAAQAAIGPARIRLDLRNRIVTAGAVRIELPPADLAFLAWFARRAKDGKPAIECPSDGVPSSEYATEYLREYHLIVGPMADADRTVARYRRGMAKVDFEERKSKLKRSLVVALGDRAEDYSVQGEGRRPMRYRLRIAADAVEFV